MPICNRHSLSDTGGYALVHFACYSCWGILKRQKGGGKDLPCAKENWPANVAQVVRSISPDRAFQRTAVTLASRRLL